jgi:urease gamma subunit
MAELRWAPCRRHRFRRGIKLAAAETVIYWEKLASISAPISGVDIMNNDRRIVALFASVLFVSAFSSTAFAQGMAMDKPMSGMTAGQYTVKTLTENERVLVRDVIYRPGDTGPMQSRDGMIIYHITNSTVERTFADGSKQVVVHKAGDAEIINEKRPYSTKNIGKNTNHLIAVTLK